MDEYLNALVKFENSCEIREEKYNLRNIIASSEKCCPWAFMRKEEIIKLLADRNRKRIQQQIGAKFMHGFPKGIPRLVAVSLMYSGAKFAMNSNYNSEQTGALLSMLYMSQRYFNSSSRITAEDVYFYFKELICYHSVDFCPDYTQIFSAEEAQTLLTYFCKIFLKHLPLVRFLGFPNFQLAVNTNILQYAGRKNAKKSSKKQKR